MILFTAVFFEVGVATTKRHTRLTDKEEHHKARLDYDTLLSRHATLTTLVRVRVAHAYRYTHNATHYTRKASPHARTNTHTHTNTAPGGAAGGRAAAARRRGGDAALCGRAGRRVGTRCAGPRNEGT